nr:GGDEF domain-containing protein [uncultured Sulfurimonas sp.]
MLSYQEKKRLIGKIIFVVVFAIIILSIVRILIVHNSTSDISTLYNLFFKELFFSIFSASLIVFLLYLFFKKELKQLNNKAIKYAFTDALTGLNNRHYLNDFLNNFTSLRKSDLSFAVVFIDVDRFKLVNDTLGHATGDCILKKLALNLQSIIRPGDILCRYGGEEFVIIFCDILKEDALSKVEYIRESVEKREFSCKKQKITISAGVGFGSKEDDINKIIEHSDKALYMAKEAGRNCIKVYNTD